jgi:hypothetical protein
MVDTRETQPVNRPRVNPQHHTEYEHRTQITEHPDAGLRLAVSRVAQLIWLLFGVLEALIGLRIVLKLIAANPANPFANLVYTFTDLFLWPFAGLTVTPSAQGMVLEIPAIIAMFVYALMGWVLVKLVWLLFYHPTTTRTVRTEEHEHEHLTD